jgi:hypothetical protein
MTRPERCRTQHPLSQAHSPTPAASAQVVYVVCGWQGCPQRRVVPVALWEAEVARRSRAPSQEAPHDGWYRRPVTTAIVREGEDERSPPALTPTAGG